MIQAKLTSCPFCDSHDIVKRGLRKNTSRQLQVYRCTNCFKYFTPLSGTKTKYSPELIAKALLLFYQGHSESGIIRLFKTRQKVSLSPRTLRRWITKYKNICTFYPLRSQSLLLFPKEKIIQEFALLHRQIYIFKKHEAKLNHLSKTLKAVNGQRLPEYLNEVTQPSFPHDLFRDDALEKASGEVKQVVRSSQVSFETLPFVTQTKQNTANDLANFGLYLAHRNVERHPMIEEFMLTCDGATIAIEVPLYLTNEELKYFQRIGFYLPIQELEKPITGHVDLLQIRNGLIHILDYKPGAKKINPTNQLLIYALALASRTRLPLKMFVCAWFDEKDYFEFYPLHAVHTKKKER